MSAALDLYAKLTETTDEKEHARLIAEAFDALEARFPQITGLATQGHVRESELRLQKEIKGSSSRSIKSRSICTRPWPLKPAGCSAASPS